MIELSRSVFYGTRSTAASVASRDRVAARRVGNRANVTEGLSRTLPNKSE